jgi:hypothetical protein
MGFIWVCWYRVLKVLVAWNFCVGHIRKFVVLVLCLCVLLTASADLFCSQLTIVKSIFGVKFVCY